MSEVITEMDSWRIATCDLEFAVLRTTTTLLEIVIASFDHSVNVLDSTFEKYSEFSTAMSF